MNRFRINTQSVAVNNRGQSLIVAVAILFLLLFIAGIFIALVGQNLTRAGRGSDIVGAQALAEAGIRHADYQLTYSGDGADWRPEKSSLVLPNDPDAAYLNDNYTRYTTGNGRFLLRVSYPGSENPDDPLSRCIKIESIGRVGLIDPEDPTTFQNTQPERLRRELVAYKPIGITDYLLFVTNKDHVADPATLGIPESPGMPTGFVSEYTGPIRVNGNLQWVGHNIIHLNKGLVNIDKPAIAPRDFERIHRGDGVEVSGEISHWQSPSGSINPGQPDTLVEVATPERNGGLPAEVFPSDDPRFTVDPFTSVDGNVVPMYRDGRASRDTNGKARWIKRLSPPLIDARNPQTGVGRYIALTKLSGKAAPNGHNTGEFGLGEGIYIDNVRDIQNNHGDLRPEWLHPRSSNSAWVVDRYEPPGIDMVFFGGGIVEITRNTQWRRLDGSFSTVYTRYYQFTTGANGPRYVVLDANNGFEPIPETESPFNGVIYAEGNIRIRGRLLDGIPLTVASGGTIYIEGNIIKGTAPSGVALLAKDYICVNTSQFFRVESNKAQPQYYTVSTWEGYTFRGDFSFGMDPTLYNVPAGEANVKLLISHRKSSDQQADVKMGTGLRRQPPDWNVGRQLGLNLDHLLWKREIYSLYGGDATWTVAGMPGDITSYEIATSGANMPQYYVQRIGIQPLDIRIEALMYAQDKCFFVIPGEWFNPDPSDTRAAVASRNDSRPMGVDRYFPFYGEPLDVRIWIKGAIAMNRTASTADMVEWCRKWGWTPNVIGPDSADPTSQVPGAHGGIGLTFIYDGDLRKPRAGGSPFNQLPLLPKLPVSPDLIFFGNKIS